MGTEIDFDQADKNLSLIHISRIVTVTDRRTGAVTARIELPPGMEEAVVTVPVKGAGPDTVAISVDREGNETVVAWSVPVDGGIRLKVTGSVSLRFAQTQTGFCLLYTSRCV